MATTSFEVYVSKDTFKFNAAHFVAFQGYRERLHGHNYRVGVRLLGMKQIGADGYVIDFGCVKDVCKKVCKRLNERFLCPQYSDVLAITTKDDSVRIECEDGSVFSFPRQDVLMLPLVHATTEELSIFLYAEVLNGLHADYLLARNIHTMEITVSESMGQEATFRLAIPNNLADNAHLDVRKYITQGEIVPMPCGTETEMIKAAKSLPPCCPNCQSTSFHAHLEKLAKAINQLSIERQENITASKLHAMMTE